MCVRAAALRTLHNSNMEICGHTCWLVCSFSGTKVVEVTNITVYFIKGLIRLWFKILVLQLSSFSLIFSLVLLPDHFPFF